jgi:hypothetical protein
LSQDYYIVFTDAETQTWYTRFLEPGYGHCYAVWWDGFNWIRMRPNLAQVVIEVLPVVESDAVAKVVLGNTAVHVQPGDPYNVRTPWMWVPATCTEACKALLGIRAPLVLTPRQLFDYLVNRKHERKERRRDQSRDSETAATAD